MKFPFFSKNNSNVKYYFALLLKECDGVAFVIKKDKQGCVLIDQEKFIYSDNWEKLNEDVDDILFKLETRLKIQFKDTIFFLYHHYIDEKTKEIQTPYFKKIKELVKNLELHALGYIECHEAVIEHLEKKDEMAVTAIMIELDKSYMSLFVYKSGKIVYSKVQKRSPRLIEDLHPLLVGIKDTMLLPARIVMYNSKDLDKEADHILTHRWSEDIFIQLPRVEVISQSQILKEMVSIFQQQLDTKSQEKEEKIIEQEVLGFRIGEEVSVKPEENIPSVQSKEKISILKNIQLRIADILGKIKTVSMRNSYKKIIIILGFIIIIFGLFLNEYYLHTGSLIVYAPFQTIKKSIDVKGSFDEEAEADIKLYIATVSAEFDESKATTGKKDIGEKAKGEITLYNFDSKEKLFQKGTSLNTSSIEFLLDEDVKVASSSLKSDLSAKVPGIAKTTVTASVLGSDGNIGEGKLFKIADLANDTYFAKNEKAFKGGTKKTIRTVAKKDYDDLRQTVINKSKTPSSNQLTKDDVTIKSLTTEELTDVVFSNEVGEEIDLVSIKGTIQSNIFYYKKSELLKFLAEQLKKNVQKGYKIENQQISYKLNKTDQKNNLTIFSLSVSAKEIKDILVKDIAQKVTGKQIKEVESLLQKEFGIKGYEYEQKGYIFFLNSYLPFFQKNIEVVISTL